MIAKTANSDTASPHVQPPVGASDASAVPESAWVAKKPLFVVNVDWLFFVSHRLPIAIEAMQQGYDVHLAPQSPTRGSRCAR